MLDVVYLPNHSDLENKKYYVYSCGELIGRIIYGEDNYYNETLRERVSGKFYSYAFREKSRDSSFNMGFSYSSDKMRGFQTLAAARYAMEKEIKEKGYSYGKKKPNIRLLPNLDKDFYPTPSKLVGLMLGGLDSKGDIKYILECSAGKGNILDACKDACERTKYKDVKRGRTAFYGFAHEVSYDAIELDEDLRSILIGKGYNVIFDNFLNFSTTKKYDLLLLNPPFSEGATHMLKALDVQKNGGQICAILNAETIRNPYTRERKELVSKLSEYNARYKFVKHAFLHSEHPSDVEVVVVWVNIPSKLNSSFILDDLERAEKIRLNVSEPTELGFGNFIDNLIASFNKERNIVSKFLNEYVSIMPYIQNSYDEREWNSPIIELKVGHSDFKYDRSADCANSAIKAIRRKYWNKLLTHEQLMSKFTSKIRDTFNSIRDEMADYDFNEYNIKNVLAKLNASLFEGVQSEIENLFNKLTKEHSYYGECSKNIHYYNGWTTNKAFKVNDKKVILPTYIYDNIWGRLDGGRAYDTLSDIERTLNYLDGRATEGVDLRTTIETHFKKGISKNIPCKYFTATFYKKGTVHITWNEDTKYLIDALNIYVGKKRDWLPFDYGKKAYHSMSDEEKAIVNEFQGKDEYNKVYCNNALYLYEPNSNAPLMLAVNE